MITLYFALIHGAEEHAGSQVSERMETLQLLQGTLTDLFTARPAPGAGSSRTDRTPS